MHVHIHIIFYEHIRKGTGMKKNIYVRDEFLGKTKITAHQLKEWEDLKLIRPVGYTDDSIPFYSDVAIEQVNHIRRLMDLGYGLSDIREIVRKVGLPKTSATHSEFKHPDQYLTVGTLAERVGVSPRTIKHWEDKRIIVPDMRSEGGFRMYSEIYVYLCRLIIDLQLFGYTLEEIKLISDFFRDFLDMKERPDAYSKSEADAKLEAMLKEIQVLFKKMDLLKQGISRWEELLKKKKKEVIQLKQHNLKRSGAPKTDPSVRNTSKGENHA